MMKYYTSHFRLHTELTQVASVLYCIVLNSILANPRGSPVVADPQDQKEDMCMKNILRNPYLNMKSTIFEQTIKKHLCPFKQILAKFCQGRPS